MDILTNECKELVLQKLESTELPDKEEQAKILFEIGETDESKKTCLELLANRIKGQKDCNPCLDEDFLLRFLRNAKFDFEKAFTKLKKFYESQRKHPEAFEFCSESAVKKAHLNKIRMSPYRMSDHSVLYINKFFYTHPSVLPMKEKFYLETLVVDEFLENPLNQMCGMTVLFDCSDFSFQKMFYYSPRIIKLYIDAMQGIFPVRLKGVHLVNVPSTFHIIYNIAYPFLSAKLRSRVHLYKDNETFKDLHAVVPPEIIPEEYGGYLKASSFIDVIKDAQQTEKNFRKISPYFYSSKH